MSIMSSRSPCSAHHSSTSGRSGVVHEAEEDLDLVELRVDRFDRDVLRRRHVRHVERDRREQHDALVQALVVLEAVQQRVRHGVGVGGHEDGGAGDGRASQRRALRRNPEAESSLRRCAGGESSRPRFHVDISTKTPRPNASGNQPPSTILTTLALKKPTSTSRNDAEERGARGQAPVPHPPRDDERQHRRDHHGAGDRDAVGGGKAGRGAEAEHQRDDAGEQRPIDARQVDLADLVARRVLHLHPRRVAELHRLLRDRKGAGDHRLRRDDRRHGRERDERVERPRREPAGRTGSRPPSGRRGAARPGRSS